MATTGERLSFISGLAGVSAAAHMKAAGGSSGISAGALLVLWSELGSNTAMVHLMADGGSPPAPSGDRRVTRSPIAGVGRMMNGG